VGNTLSREEKLLKRSEYVRLSASGKKYHTSHFIILWAHVDSGKVRLGITASRRLGNAVTRNLVKRRLREFYRLNKSQFIAADYNIIAKKGAESLTYHEICTELEKAVRCIRNMKCSNGC
jgi:ribonuclease P protein component